MPVMRPLALLMMAHTAERVQVQVRALAHTLAKEDILAKEVTLDLPINMVLRPVDFQVLVPDPVLDTVAALVTLSVDQADRAVPTSEEQPPANTSPPTLALEAQATATSTPNPATVTK